MSRYTDTLIADEHGIYDPSSPTDRMVLGLRGQMSEMELETSIHRMMAGRLHKAQRGEFRATRLQATMWTTWIES